MKLVIGCDTIRIVNLKGKRKKEGFLDFIKRTEVIQIKYISFMNIHLLPSPELNKETYRNVLNLLQQFRGPLIHECEQDVLSNNSNEEERGWGKQKIFETSLYSIINHA
jgi:hypothetical protein